MNRTGVAPGKVMQLLLQIKGMKGLFVAGLHVYDGHVREPDVQVRAIQINEAFNPVASLLQEASFLFSHTLKIVAGGTPSFAIHGQRKEVECSPGTFVFWDWGYSKSLPDAPFMYAALVVTRVISVIDEYTICTDLGYKSVAAENPLPRVFFINAPGAVAVSQSEEHLVLKLPAAHSLKIGAVLYGIPFHICPTVALYEVAYAAENNRITATLKVVARDRKVKI